MGLSVSKVATGAFEQNALIAFHCVEIIDLTAQINECLFVVRST